MGGSIVLCMDKCVVDKVCESLRLARPELVSEDGAVIDMRAENFLSVIPVSGKKVVFVDGGNASIVSSPDVCVQLVRVYACVMESRRVVAREKREWYVVVTSDVRDGVVVFVAHDVENEVVFPVFSSVNGEGRRVLPETIGGTVRKLLELVFAREMVKWAGAGGVLVRDGDLVPQEEVEVKYFAELCAEAKKQGVLLCGLSKTTRLLTSSGRSAREMFLPVAPRGCWAYLLGKVGEVKQWCVQLHEKSEYVFRCDVLCEKAVQVLSVLAGNSDDPLFLGYPYGLVDADRFARVSQEEAEQLKLLFHVRSKEQFRGLDKSLDAHDVLNRVV